MSKVAKTIKRQLIWKTTTNRFVAFIDIMGFKDMVFRSDQREIYQLMRAINDKKAFFESKKSARRNPKLIKTATYSDSIMIYSYDGSRASFETIEATVASFSDELLGSGVPHKGALAFGEMTLDYDRSIFFGKPLINAFELQDQLLFYGIIVHGSVEEVVKENNWDSVYTREYLCPLKNGAAHHLTIPATYADSANDSLFEEDYQKLVTALEKFRFTTSGYLRKYIDNTMAYFRFLNLPPAE